MKYLVFEPAERIRQRPGKIDFAARDHERGFWTLCTERLGRRKETESRFVIVFILHEVVTLSGFELEREASIYLQRNTDPCFTPGSTLGFGPDSESNSAATGYSKMTEPHGFT